MKYTKNLDKGGIQKFTEQVTEKTYPHTPAQGVPNMERLKGTSHPKSM